MSTQLDPQHTVHTRHGARVPPPASVAGGNLGAAVVNGVLYYLINVAPGWQAVPFLTADTPRVLPAVNAAIIASIVVNIVTALVRAPRLRALGDVVTIGFGIVALIELWTVFPFDYGPDSAWTVVTRVLLAVGFVGSGFGLLVSLVRIATGRPA
ncbi:hypothetical protein [Intrasporangium sp. YIM S08009]|uniref:hypothetical protein n=1 Tax=Intrasporangium zincisolvens TaxID=3080018 RepID=UPI002B061B49|nr:hypothetical protein [Intrasporangium sp. YIM S08009]